MRRTLSGESHGMRYTVTVAAEVIPQPARILPAGTIPLSTTIINDGGPPYNPTEEAITRLADAVHNCMTDKSIAAIHPSKLRVNDEV